MPPRGRLTEVGRRAATCRCRARRRPAGSVAGSSCRPRRAGRRACSRIAARPTVPVGRTPGRVRAAALPVRRGRGAAVGAVSAGSCRSTASSRRRISSDGSTPSSSARPLAQATQRLQGVGLARALVLRQRQQRPQPLAVGMLWRELGQPTQRLIRSTEVEQGTGAHLLQREQQLLEPAGLAEHHGGVAVGVRRGRPHRPGLVREAKALLRGVGRQRLSRPTTRSSTCRRRRARPPASSRRPC